MIIWQIIAEICQRLDLDYCPSNIFENFTKESIVNGSFKVRYGEYMKKKSQKQLKQEQLILEETNNNLFQNKIEKVMEYIRSKKLYAFYYHKNEKNTGVPL